jgi:hypothetical protein
MHERGAGGPRGIAQRVGGESLISHRVRPGSVCCEPSGAKAQPGTRRGQVNEIDGGNGELSGAKAQPGTQRWGLSPAEQVFAGHGMSKLVRIPLASD